MLSSMSKWILTAKLVLISSGVVSFAMAIKFVVPLMINFAVHELPMLCSALLSLFKPPYIYVIINGIIITIVASTRFTQSEPSPTNDQSQPLITARTPPPIEISAAFVAVEELPPPEVAEVVVVYEEEKVLEVKKPVVVNGFEVVENDEEEVENEEVKYEEMVVSRSAYTPPQIIASEETEAEILLPVTEKPLVLSRFGNQKPLKASPQGGRALRIARPKRHETLESTWRMITEGRHVPPTRHLKKSDTFQNYGCDMDVIVSDENCSPQNPYVLKSETFKDRTNYRDLPMSSGKIPKEPSLSQDELNSRVEAFINKFNEEMRLQRQESLKKYMEMINRGAYY